MPKVLPLTVCYLSPLLWVVCSLDWHVGNLHVTFIRVRQYSDFPKTLTRGPPLLCANMAEKRR